MPAACRRACTLPSWKFWTVSGGLPAASSPPSSSAPPLPYGAAAMRESGRAQQPCRGCRRRRVLLGRIWSASAAAARAGRRAAVGRGPMRRTGADAAKRSPPQRPRRPRAAGTTPALRARDRAACAASGSERSVARWCSGSMPLISRPQAAREPPGRATRSFRGSLGTDVRGCRRLVAPVCRVAPTSDRMILGARPHSARLLASLDGSAVATPTPPSPRARAALRRAHPVPEGSRRYNIAPTQTIVAIVRGEDGEPQARAMRWGLIPPWAKDAKIAYKMINARSRDRRREGRLPAPGRHRRPARPARRRRLLRVAALGGRQAAARARSASRSPMAGRSPSPGCGRPATLDGEAIESVTILTTAANPLVARDPRPHAGDPRRDRDSELRVALPGARRARRRRRCASRSPPERMAWPRRTRS